MIDTVLMKHLQDMYGMNPNLPHPALQFPRLPPGLAGSMFKIHQIPMRQQFSENVSTMNQKLHGFQQMYQQYAAGLLSMNSSIIPPGHPLYTRQNSIETLQTENDKLVKENLELKKKLEKNSEKNNH